ncbi:alpha/beta hydrolase family protein [Homoserinibacter sp. YIM 151385]|uniref:alpha/beta hydrolase family protein n=1 Tax=Homoserinibacter sp. YIM 151385 TaxID=2985506 RepID=UPI0022EFFEEB|nr:alpha/beta fold hydrolase [Homoserinibacter sp. YIM 151385]WBU38516.1 alpha/beta fold hydrolase [Homoserinibacter sp. YIM 151385]
MSARSWCLAGAVLAGVGGAAALGVAGLSLAIARTIVTPPRRRPDDIRILEVDVDRGEITLEAGPETLVPGRYGLWFSHDQGYARIGEVLRREPDRVVRRILEVEAGELGEARSGRWSGWLHRSPATLSHAWEAIEIPTPHGPAPAWVVPAEGDGTRWAVLVHGRAVTRAETLRAIEPMLADGRSVLMVSYRNDPDAPASPDGRYALGLEEWRDVDAALDMLRGLGARDLVLMGWSMGGATVLQTLARSPHAELVRGAVLDSPAVDWRTVIDQQIVALRGLPRALSRIVQGVLGSRLASRVVGLDRPIDLDALDWVARADELAVPVLILHSDGDDFVPPSASRRLAARRPDLVRYEAFDTARHTRLWNYDPERWSGAIRDWLRGLPQSAQRV